MSRKPPAIDITTNVGFVSHGLQLTFAGLIGFAGFFASGVGLAKMIIRLGIPQEFHTIMLLSVATAIVLTFQKPHWFSVNLKWSEMDPSARFLTGMAMLVCSTLLLCWVFVYLWG